MFCSCRQLRGRTIFLYFEASYMVSPCHGVTMCRDLRHKVDAVKPDRAETDRFRTEESSPAICLWQRDYLHRSGPGTAIVRRPSLHEADTPQCRQVTQARKSRVT